MKFTKGPLYYFTAGQFTSIVWFGIYTNYDTPHGIMCRTYIQQHVANIYDRVWSESINDSRDWKSNVANNHQSKSNDDPSEKKRPPPPMPY